VVGRNSGGGSNCNSILSHHLRRIYPTFCVGFEINAFWDRRLRDHARTIAGKNQLFVNAYAKALEVIPRQLADNAGFDATDILNKLRQKHAAKDGNGKDYGVDIDTGGLQLHQNNPLAAW
jgi:TCP-1/cpn60 chaperonin family